ALSEGMRPYPSARIGDQDRRLPLEERQELGSMGTRLYVGNLPFSADEDQIRELFAQNGREVSEVKLITDRDTGRPRGFAFVEMASSDDADGAIRQLNGYE